MTSTSSPEAPHVGEDPRADDSRTIINALLTECAEWMRQRCRHVSRQYDLDPNDVFQLALERLLRSSHEADLTNDGLRTWLGRRIDWAAGELARKQRHDGGERLGPGEVDTRLEEADVRACHHDTVEIDGVDAKFLARIGLTPHQVGVLLGECGGLDLSMREYAQLTGLSYAAVRKHKQRALERLERWIGLTDDERRAYIASRTTTSTAEAARRARCPLPEYQALLDTAQKKVHDAFSERKAGSNVS